MAVSPYKFIKENPMQYVKIPKNSNTKVTQEKIKVLTLDEFKTILNRFPFGSNFYIPLQIAFNTGLRCGEVCALTWANIDFDSKTLTVEHTLIEKRKRNF